MIDKDKHPKTAEDFEKWVKKTYAEDTLNDFTVSYIFLFPEEMQAGVYLKYFDEFGIYIDIKYGLYIDINYRFHEEGHKYWGFKASVCDRILEKRIDLDGYNSRLYALQEAIQKAAEIREKQL